MPEKHDFKLQPRQTTKEKSFLAVPMEMRPACFLLTDFFVIHRETKKKKSRTFLSLKFSVLSNMKGNC